MLARLYHAHHNRHLEDLPFWLMLARQQGSPIMELGCGSGRVLLPLAQAGFRVVGLERDPDMLSTLHEIMEPGLAGQVELVQGDMADFELGRRFALILTPCNTFSTLSTTQRKATLVCVSRHLQPEGLFAASLPNPTLLQRLPRWGEPEVEETFPHPQDGEPVQVSSSWERTEAQFNVRWDYDHLLPDGRVERVSMHARHSLAGQETYYTGLEDAGMNPVACYGDFDQSPYTPEAPFLILVASL